MNIHSLFILLQLCSCYFTLDQTQSTKLDKTKTQAYPEKQKTFGIGQVSRCLLRHKQSVNHWADCVLELTDVVGSGAIERNVGRCLTKIKLEASSFPSMTEEGLLFEYYSCLLSAELAYLRHAKEQPRSSELSWIRIENVKYFILRAESLMRRLLIWGCILVLALKDHSRLRNIRLKERLASKLPWLLNRNEHRFCAINVQMIKLKTELLKMLHELYQSIEGSFNASAQGKSADFGEKENDDLKLEPVTDLSGGLGDGSLIRSGGENTTGIDLSIKLRDLSVNLMPKDRALVFDLTTKEGRRDWKTYVNRDKSRPSSCREKGFADGGLPVKKASLTCTADQNAHLLEEDSELENVALYNKHGKPLRRIFVPKIGWISRRKYLEQRG
ncbi:LAME_0F01860g1_1 [Lachancea meyersii CBS 8951]|uniref:LAME_0F01860g1_1 n=1 Tax=Lachancea meyersii CBS 8951 TaxID=1266667 RepID=A0A1G4JQG4_9SACH|nr:LAME_0F01860g1_1 [Lachancea meyersii CBS 8951]